MRLLFVHDHPFYVENKDVYSAGSFPLNVWTNYTKYFNELVVFARKSGNIKNRKSVSSGNDKVTFHLTSNYRSSSSLLFSYFKIKKEIQQNVESADIVLVRLPSILGYIAANIVLKNDRKLIVEQVGNTKEAFLTHGSFQGKVIARLLEHFNKKIVNRASYVSYVTESKLQKHYPSSVQALTASISNVILPNTISIDELDSSRFKSDPFKIGLIGGFDVKYKGQDVLLSAISLMNDEIKERIELYFVGKGDPSWVFQRAKELLVSNNIKFIGQKESGKEVFDFLSTLSLYVQPSLTEGMPRALLEAMSRGCAVLGSNVGGIPDIVHGDYIHQPNDHKSLSKQIETLFRNRELLYNLAKENITKVQPFLKSELDKKRDLFYHSILNDLSNA